MIRKAIAIVLAIVVFNLLFFVSYNSSAVTFFTVPLIGTLGFLIFVVSAQIYLFVGKYKDLNKDNKKYAYLLSGVAILSSLIALFRANFIDSFLLNFLSGILTLILIYVISLANPLSQTISEFLVVPQRLFMVWIRGFLQIFNLLPQTLDLFAVFLKRKLSLSSKKSEIGSVIRGILIAIPIAAFVLILLGSADPIFGKLVKDIFNIKLPPIAPWLIARIVGTSAFLFFAAPFLFSTIKKKYAHPFKDIHVGKYQLETATLVSILCTIFAVFLVIQFKYLFVQVPENKLSEFGIMTYSEYVRRGFGELTLVAVVVYFTSIISSHIYSASEKSKKLLRNLNLALLFEILVFIISILRRVYLYQIAHGLTRIRIYGSAFLILLIALTIVLITRQLISTRKKWFLSEIGLCIGALFLVGVVNVDKLIANNFPPTVNNEVDYVYISKLSPDAVDGWIAAYDNAKKEVERVGAIPASARTPDDVRKIVYSSLTLQNINSNYSSLIGRNESPYRKYDFNFAEKNAYEKLKNTIIKKELEAVLTKSFNLYSSLNSFEKYQRFDRSLESPLVR
ncbi:MAG TPA: DUF4173 domain-containing protein [Patescibacteria group bacterium]